MNKAPSPGKLSFRRIQRAKNLSAFGSVALYGLYFGLWSSPSSASPFDAAPFGQRLPQRNGLVWEDPREIHKVVVHFNAPVANGGKVHLEYWGSRWPEQHLPKDRAPGGGDVGWMELGNWYRGGWRVADTETTTEGATISFTFHEVNKSEFPKLTAYPADYRYTLKIRGVSDEALPRVDQIEAYTDSSIEPRTFLLAEGPSSWSEVTAFNGKAVLAASSGRRRKIEADCVVNQDPNTFDRTLITVHGKNAVQPGRDTFTFDSGDLNGGPLFLPDFGVAILQGDSPLDYAAVADAQKNQQAKTLYDRVRQMPEQTWTAAWSGLPPKKVAHLLPFRARRGAAEVLTASGRHRAVPAER